jgi:hypothetical protein
VKHADFEVWFWLVFFPLSFVGRAASATNELLWRFCVWAAPSDIQEFLAREDVTPEVAADAIARALFERRERRRRAPR